MAAKKSAEVIIDGKVYTLSGYEEEDYLQKVGAYINNKISEFNEMEEFRRLSADTGVRFLPSILQTIILRQRNLSTNIRWIWIKKKKRSMILSMT